MDIALPVLPIITTVILSLVTQCCHLLLLLGGLIRLRPGQLAFNSSNWAAAAPSLRSGTRKRARTKLFKCVGAPLTSLHLIGLVMGISSGSSHCGGLGFTQCIYSRTAIQLSLKIPSSTLSHGISGIPSSSSVGHLLINTSANHSNKLLIPL